MPIWDFMKKKNTLLYLDEKLVKLAKKHNLNMSHLAEAAIRSQLLPILSVRERQLDFHQHLKDLKEEGYCYELPQTIRAIKLKNMGPIEKLELNLVKGVNVILGPNASGKSIIIRAIANAFGL
jgi:hypothetical protein